MTLTVKQLCDRLSVSRKNVENWIGRKSVHVDLPNPGRGRAVYLDDAAAFQLGVFAVLAELIGPARAREICIQGFQPDQRELFLDNGLIAFRLDIDALRQRLKGHETISEHVSRMVAAGYVSGSVIADHAGRVPLAS